MASVPPRAPAVTVATAMRNAAATLPQAIESVLAQSFGDFEFLLLDDGSTDASRAMAEGFAARDPRVRVIAAPPQGLVASLNQLFAQARAPWVARFDADDICMPARLERQMAFLKAHPEHGLIGCETLFIDETGGPASTPPIRRPHDHDAIVAALEHGPILCHSAVMVRRDLVRDAGGYRPAYVHAEDYDLWLRLAGRTRIANLEECLLAYRVSTTQVSSRHMVTQAHHAAIAWLAHRLRTATGRDPTDGLATLPDIDTLDALLGPGSAAYARKRVIDRVLFAPERLAGDAWPALKGHIAEAGPQPHLWRAALRLLRSGHAARGSQALLALVSAGLTRRPVSVPA
ncbi:glycosyltransferase family 2 protein [Novosphingobium sp.]|uniref:glycosyltransferase family 2 protein n=1 Tax=Novosphingobium sp. TaxID=1874826 RepID=UPI002FDE42FE